MAYAAVVSPTSCKIKTRNAYLRMKNCSPKFKTVLRQRYKERVENSRTQLLSIFRHNNCEGSHETEAQDWSKLESKFHKVDLLKDILENNKTFNLDEELLLEDDLKEELTQFENWLLQEYESIWNEEEYDEIIITCPLCCCGSFKVVDSCASIIYCTKCYLTLTSTRSMLEIQNDIFNEVDKHNSNCTLDPSFVQVPGDEMHSNLCIVCDICGYLQVII